MVLIRGHSQASSCSLSVSTHLGTGGDFTSPLTCQLILINPGKFPGLFYTGVEQNGLFQLCNLWFYQTCTSGSNSSNPCVPAQQPDLKLPFCTAVLHGNWKCTKSTASASCMEAVGQLWLPFISHRKGHAKSPPVLQARRELHSLGPGSTLLLRHSSLPCFLLSPPGPNSSLLSHLHSCDLVWCETGAIDWKTILVCNHSTVFRFGTVQK